MRLRDDQKRRHILESATRLFATEPFHKVRLDDVASAAGVGKGTLYIYFSSKEDLYFSIFYEGFSALVDGLREQLSAEPTPTVALETIVAGLTKFAFQNPQMFELMRTVPVPKDRGDWDGKRVELTALIEQAIRRGIERGELEDPRPDLTAQYVPGLVRSAMLFGPSGLDHQELVSHILRLLRQGIYRRSVS
jgi:AcrR family transcriptional regulator